MLGLYEWMGLIRELGWYDDAVTEAQFLSRLDEWDVTAESALAAQSGT